MSLNLAQHPQRQTLRQAGLDLPGVLVSGVVPGLDVLSPYEDGGCLLTLPEGESSGGRWERELRGRFGGRVLPQVVPHDVEVQKALLAGQVVVTFNPESSAASCYHSLTRTLNLAEKGREAVHHSQSPLLVAAASFQPAVLVMAGRGAGLSASEGESEPDLSASNEYGKDPLPASGLRSSLADLLPPPPPPPLPVPSVVEAEESDSDQEPADLPEQPVAPPPAALSGRRSPLWVLWVGLSALLGCSVRFFKLPDFMVPVVVGSAVTAAIVVVLRFLLTGREAAPHQPRVRPADNGRPEEGRRTTPRPNSRNDVHARLSALARRSGTRYRREADEN